MASVLTAGSLRASLAVIAVVACLGPLPAVGQSRSGEIEFEGLQPQELTAGSCGLFLWSRSADPTFILVAYDTPAAAHVRANGRDRSLRRTEFSGERVYGHFEQQTFSDERLTLSVELEFDEGRPLRDGAIVQEGVVRVRNREGWETIMPVGGMVACKI